MENNTDHEKKDRPVTGIASVESTATNADSTEFANFISHDSAAKTDHGVTDDPAERREMQDEYFDNKENPGRNYNINDQAYSQTSKDDFVKTVSNFKHADGENSAESPQVPD